MEKTGFIFKAIEPILRSIEPALKFIALEGEAQQIAVEWFVFFTLVGIALAIGRLTPFLVKLGLQRAYPQRADRLYEHIVRPIRHLFRLVGTSIVLSLAIEFIPGRLFFNLLNFLTDTATILGVAWLASRIFRLFVRAEGIGIIRSFGWEVDELLLVFEAVANIIIVLFALIIFAQTRNIQLVPLLASFGIGGLAIAFAAQKTLEQLLGTVVLYLDRPFVPGEYIRTPNGMFGRIEAVGLRSTKIRTSAKGTLMIIPNSTMANLDIENVSRGKKVMVLLYLDFLRILEPREEALVEQVVQECTNALYGIDPGSTRISTYRMETQPTTQARVTFFILGSSENSIQLRKRLLELANEKISKRLADYGIQFNTNDPTIYVESPITI